jgi:hypothetical protein
MFKTLQNVWLRQLCAPKVSKAIIFIFYKTFFSVTYRSRNIAAVKISGLSGFLEIRFFD